MNHNAGPARLISEMKTLNGEKDGFQIISKLNCADEALLIEFRPFKQFMNDLASKAGLKRSGEFYFNFAGSGFTGIVCFNGSHVSLQTEPASNEVRIEFFLSDRILNNINIAENLYRGIREFLGSTVVEEAYNTL
jgi:S-adenosylmethionine/arginine decarboxylase-like enzyme